MKGSVRSGGVSGQRSPLPNLSAKNRTYDAISRPLLSVNESTHTRKAQPLCLICPYVWLHGPGIRSLKITATFLLLTSEDFFLYRSSVHWSPNRPHLTHAIKVRDFPDLEKGNRGLSAAYFLTSKFRSSQKRRARETKDRPNTRIEAIRPDHTNVRRLAS